jgi:putative membrane protein
MMYGYYGHGHGMSGWGWFAMIFSTVLTVALFALLAAVLYRLWDGDRRRPAAAAPTDERAAERILAERFARGEIDETEYRSRLAVLRSDRS